MLLSASPTFILDWLSHWVRKVLLFAASYFVDFLLIVISFGWFFWVFTWSRQVTRKVGESTQKEILSVLQERRNSFLRRSVKAFLRMHHLNKNLKTAVGVSQTEQEESLPAERMGMCDGGKHSVCRAMSKPEQQEG